MISGLHKVGHQVCRSMQACMSSQHDIIQPPGRRVEDITLQVEGGSLFAKLNDWVHQKPKEIAIRRQIMNEIEIINGQLHIKNNLEICDNNELTSLPDGLHVGGNVKLIGCNNLTMLPKELKINGDLDVRHCKNLTTFSDGLIVVGGIWLLNLLSLEKFPKKLNVGGDFTINACRRLKTLPEALTVNGDFYLEGCAQLEKLPNQLKVLKSLVVQENERLISLSYELRVDGDLYVNNCKRLALFPDSLKITRSLQLIGCDELISLPDNLVVFGKLEISRCTSLWSLPQELSVLGDLKLSSCTNLKKMPQILKVDGNIDISECGDLTALPELRRTSLNIGEMLRADSEKRSNLIKEKVDLGLLDDYKGSITLSGCTNLNKLPKGLTVAGNLKITNCANLIELPQGLTVAENLEITNCMNLLGLPYGLNVSSKVKLRECDRLNLSENLRIRGIIDLSALNHLKSLPKGLIVNGSLNLSGCTSLTEIHEDILVEGRLDLSGCTSLRKLNKNITVKGDLNLNGCTTLLQVQENITVKGDLNLSGCSSLLEIDNNLTVNGSLNLSNCSRLTKTPRNLTVKGNTLNLSGCTNLTEISESNIRTDSILLENCSNLSIIREGLRFNYHLELEGCSSLRELPEWMFSLIRDTSSRGLMMTIRARNTGIPVRLIAEYNRRQNLPNYIGPRLLFSIRDYQNQSEVTAQHLPSLINELSDFLNKKHAFWTLAETQSEPGSLFNSFATFLTRLLNELPAGKKYKQDMIKLKEIFSRLFRKMEAEYDFQDGKIEQCDLINNHILSAAETAIGTCIDKVKVGYLFMQIYIKDDYEANLNEMAAIIKTVEDIQSARIVFNKSTNEFIHTANTILNGDFSKEIKLQAKLAINQTSEASVEIFDDEWGLLENNNVPPALVPQYLAQLIPDSTSLTIGDEVEDILNLAYKLLCDDFHKIDMNYAFCCTLKNASEPNGPQYETAAINYIRQQLDMANRHNIRDQIIQRYSEPGENTTTISPPDRGA